jgi:hypothetical protein
MQFNVGVLTANTPKKKAQKHLSVASLKQISLLHDKEQHFETYSAHVSQKLNFGPFLSYLVTAFEHSSSK